MKLGITPTLLNSFDLYNSCTPSWKEKIYDDIVKTIKRLPKKHSKAIKRGLEFEDAVQRVCEDISAYGKENLHNDEYFKKVIIACSGGVFQQWCQYYFEHDGKKIRAYGKIDVTLPKKIIDIKTTANYKGHHSYISGWQPEVYLLSTNKSTFEFIIAVWENAFSSKIKTIHTVKYVANEGMERSLIEQYDRFVIFLHNNNLYDDYVYTFCKNSRD